MRSDAKLRLASRLFDSWQWRALNRESRRLDIAEDLITTAEACCVVGGSNSPIHESTLWRWVKSKRISPPLKIGPQMMRFRKSVLIDECARLAASPRPTRIRTNGKFVKRDRVSTVNANVHAA